VVDGTPSMVTVYVMVKLSSNRSLWKWLFWNYFQRENTVDGGGRREEEGSGAYNWG
jgi:hypothetical protein